MSYGDLPIGIHSISLEKGGGKTVDAQSPTHFKYVAVQRQGDGAHCIVQT